jgi:hypothetical protein
MWEMRLALDMIADEFGQIVKVRSAARGSHVKKNGTRTRSFSPPNARQRALHPFPLPSPARPLFL